MGKYQTMKHPYIVAEIGGNHNGEMELAKKMITSAKENGADCVKFQMYGKDTLCTFDYLNQLNSGEVKLENVNNWSSKELGLNNIFDQVEKFAVEEDEHIEYFKYAREIGIDYSTSAFTKSGIDFCVEQKVSYLKIASCDVTNLDLIEYAISKDYPLQIALGMASLGEIENIVNMIPERQKSKVTLLHCVSLYPPKDGLVNLKFIQTLRNTFGLNVGYSDHTLGFSIPLAAVALGASVIEKHFTLDKDMPGWDHKVSANPEELKIICEESKRIYEALGTGIKVVSEEEIAKRKKFRRSVTSRKPLEAGHIITYDDIVFKRPGTGIPADRFNEIIGRRVNHDIEEDKTIFYDDLIK